MTNFHVVAGADATLAHPVVRKVQVADLFEALRDGLDDFGQKPSHVAFLCILYPLIGVVLAAWTSGANALPMLFPLASGFALLGPVAAIGLYEISRRRERGEPVSWRDALAVRHSPALPSILAVGALLLALFVAWLLAAQAIYVSQFGPEPPASLAAFATELFSTSEGWRMILLGNAVGFCFAVVVLAMTVVAFPLLLDRDVGAVAAIETSARVVWRNPVTMAAWGLFVALLLALGSIPLFAGLAVVMPVLGHATWHLYRKAVVCDDEPEWT